jgi:predicted amidophosphoribosyltransferase
MDILDILFPQEHCYLCQKPGRYSNRKPWCHECNEKVLALTKISATCHKCGKYIEEGELCHDCRKRYPQFELARAVGPYEGCFRVTTKIL